MKVPLLPARLAVLALALVPLACAPAASPPAPRPAATSAPATTAGAPAAAAPAASQPRPIETIKVSFAAESAIYAPFFIARDKGYLAEEGLEMEIIRAGGGAATPALIAGELDYSTSASTALSAMLKGAPLKIVYTNSDRPIDELWSGQPEIRTLHDLPGKSVGIQTRGDTMEIETRLILMQHGIDPNSVIFQAMGVGSQRLAAIQAGTISAAILSIFDVAQFGDNPPRGHRLASILEEVQMLYTGLATSDRELQANRDRVRRFLRASTKGREYYRAFREETIQILMKQTDIPYSVAAADYDATLPAMTQDGTITPEIQRRDSAVRAEVNQVDTVPPMEQMYDYSFMKEIYQQLQASGWRPTR